MRTKGEIMINFIICDDEKAITDVVKNIITKVMIKNNYEYKTHVFNSYNKEFNNIINSNLENKIYILDIEVGKISGIDIAKKIRNKDWNSTVLILSAHFELETLAYKSKILLFDFISKFDLYDKEIYSTINLCVNNIINSDKLVIKSSGKLEQIEYDDILFITYDSYKRKSIIITKQSEYKTGVSLKNMKDRVKGSFVYTHKSCIVNTKNIKTIDLKNKLIIFKNDKATDLLSRKYIKDVIEYVNN